MQEKYQTRRGFTLVEIMVVVSIIAILAIAVTLTLNPFQLLAQSRDAKRIGDITALNIAAGTYYSSALNNPSTMFMGTSSVIYVSIPDPNATSTAGDQCQGLNLPAFSSSTFSYHCAASSTYLRTDGTGWVPINFASYPGGNIISPLPVDPKNTTSTGLYYTYETDGVGGYKFTAPLEAAKNLSLMQNDQGDDPELYEKGTNLALASGLGTSGYYDVDAGGLVLWEAFDEGSGTAVTDYSGYNNTGTWSGSLISGSHYTTGRVGPYSGNFNGNDDVVVVPTSPSIGFGGPFTMMAWVYTTTSTPYQEIMMRGTQNSRDGGFYLQAGNTSAIYVADKGAVGISSPWAVNGWTHIALTEDGTYIKIYINGQLVASTASTLVMTTSTNSLGIGQQWQGGYPLFGQIDDARLYNRVLSANEIQAIYNGEK